MQAVVDGEGGLATAEVDEGDGGTIADDGANGWGRGGQ